MSGSGDVPKIVLIPHETSHPFARRECVMREALKVGRSVDRRRISANNLIFDCRVLSRNHALIWFENGKVSVREREPCRYQEGKKFLVVCPSVSFEY